MKNNARLAVALFTEVPRHGHLMNIKQCCSGKFHVIHLAKTACIESVRPFLNFTRIVNGIFLCQSGNVGGFSLIVHNQTDDSNQRGVLIHCRLDERQSWIASDCTDIFS